VAVGAPADAIDDVSDVGLIVLSVGHGMFTGSLVAARLAPELAIGPAAIRRLN